MSTKIVEMTPAQCRAGRALLEMTQTRLAEIAGLGLSTIVDFEKSRRTISPDAEAAILRALEASGVEFTNGEQPGVRMKSYKLKDAGKNAFVVGPVAKWIGFGAVDDAGRPIEVHVEDIALERLDPSIVGGADHTRTLQAHRRKIFKIAAEKYEGGLIQPGNVICVTDADVAQRLG